MLQQPPGMLCSWVGCPRRTKGHLVQQPPLSAAPVQLDTLLTTCSCAGRGSGLLEDPGIHIWLGVLGWVVGYRRGAQRTGSGGTQAPCAVMPPVVHRATLCLPHGAALQVVAVCLPLSHACAFVAVVPCVSKGHTCAVRGVVWNGRQGTHVACQTSGFLSVHRRVWHSTSRPTPWGAFVFYS